MAVQRSDWRIVMAVVLFVAAILAGAITVASTMPTQSVGIGTILSGVATLILAGLTAIILIVNARVLQATKEAAEATRDAARATKAEADATLEEAKATREQAEATKEQVEIAAQSIRESQISREFDWRPFLVRMDTGSRIVKGRLIRDMTVQNIGRGPALNAIYMREEDSPDGTVFLRTGPLNLGLGPPIAVPAEQQDEKYPKLFLRPTDSPREMLVCHDQFGNWYRFIPGYPAPWVWREERDEDGYVISGQEEPAWVAAMKDILWEQPKRLPPEPDPGYAFYEAVSIGGAYAFCHSTVALEAVPATDLKPTDEMRDVVDHWMRQMQPEAQTTSPEVARWQAGHPSKMGDAWAGWLNAGPMIGVLQVLDVAARPRLAGGGLEGDLRISALVKWWERVVREGLAVLTNLGVHRWRLGLTLVVSGSFDHTQLVDVDFAGLPKPERWLHVPSHEIRNWSFQSRPFAAFPASDIDTAARRVLRMFGYRKVDAVMETLGL